MIVELISPFYFFLAFGIGLLIVYMYAPRPEVVVKFPSPYNAGKIKYKDKHDNCYIIKASNVACPVDKSKIKPQPLLD